MGEGLARPINNPGGPHGCFAVVADQDLLPLLELGARLLEGYTMRLQTLGKDRIAFPESCETSLESVHERWFWGGYLPLIGHCSEVILEVGKTLLTFEYEPFSIG